MDANVDAWCSYFHMAHVDAYENIDAYDTAQKMEFPIKDFFTECDQIRNFLRIWSHLLNKSSMENFFFFGIWCH